MLVTLGEVGPTTFYRRVREVISDIIEVRMWIHAVIQACVSRYVWVIR